MKQNAKILSLFIFSAAALALGACNVGNLPLSSSATSDNTSKGEDASDTASSDAASNADGGSSTDKGDTSSSSSSSSQDTFGTKAQDFINLLQKELTSCKSYTYDSKTFVPSTDEDMNPIEGQYDSRDVLVKASLSKNKVYSVVTTENSYGQGTLSEPGPLQDGSTSSKSSYYYEKDNKFCHIEASEWGQSYFENNISWYNRIDEIANNFALPIYKEAGALITDLDKLDPSYTDVKSEIIKNTDGTLSYQISYVVPQFEEGYQYSGEQNVTCDITATADGVLESVGSAILHYSYVGKDDAATGTEAPSEESYDVVTVSDISGVASDDPTIPAIDSELSPSDMSNPVMFESKDLPAGDLTGAQLEKIATSLPFYAEGATNLSVKGTTDADAEHPYTYEETRSLKENLDPVSNDLLGYNIDIAKKATGDYFKYDDNYEKVYGDKHTSTYTASIAVDSFGISPLKEAKSEDPKTDDDFSLDVAPSEFDDSGSNKYSYLSVSEGALVVSPKLMESVLDMYNGATDSEILGNICLTSPSGNDLSGSKADDGTITFSYKTSWSDTTTTVVLKDDKLVNVTKKVSADDFWKYGEAVTYTATYTY
jgi:hypothetical protein